MGSHTKGYTPLDEWHTVSLKQGKFYYGMRRKPAGYIAAAKQTSDFREAACRECNEPGCGKPALRVFHGANGFYGRCKAHLSGGEIPRSYKAVSIKERKKP